MQLTCNYESHWRSAVEGIEELADGLVLRRATVADTEALVAFNAEIHQAPGADIRAFISSWTRDLMSGDHPTCGPGDFTVVVDSKSDEIVSSLNMIPQTWSYGGIPFGVGRIELVGTRPDYRRRGLVRRQMEVVHRWSADRGHLIQAITGIPHYYRQFGYEMALELGGSRTGFSPHVPELAAETTEQYKVRPATIGDVPFIAALEERARRRSLVAAVRDAKIWSYELEGRAEDAGHVVCVIEGPHGEPVGYLVHVGELWGNGLVVRAYELEVGYSWLAVSPGVLRYLKVTGESYQEREGATAWERFTFALGTEHPVYRAISGRLPRTASPYAFYLRAPSLAAFVRHVTPVLEERLADSIAAGHSGELQLGFYQDGLRLVLDRGRLATVEAWEPGDNWETAPGFPGLTFHQLLFGYRSLAELEYAFADCRVDDEESRVLIDTLFPKQPSYVWPVD
jgi:GNAT superfamily N-acetyltransferase